MFGFNIDNEGNVISLAPAWEPETVTVVDGEEVVSKNVQPDNTAYPDNFDEVLASMLAPAKERLSWQFKDNVGSSAPDEQAMSFYENVILPAKSQREAVMNSGKNKVEKNG